MPSAQGIRAGRAFVELFADDRKLVRGLRRAEKKLRAFGASIRGLGHWDIHEQVRVKTVAGGFLRVFHTSVRCDSPQAIRQHPLSERQ